MSGSAATLAFADLHPDDILATLGENRVYQVGIEDDAPVVAKFYRPGRWSDAAILEEHEFAIDLAEQEIPLIPPLALAGNTLHHSGHYRLAVYPCHGGRAPDLDNFDLQKQLGRLVARIHLEGATRRFEHRPRIDIQSYGVESLEYLLDNDFIPEDNRDAYESVAALVLDGVAACFERSGNVREIRLHGDFHPGNVLVARDQLHIVDLDDARHGPAIQDLWMFLSGDRDEQTPQLTALLEGYQSFRPFDARELHLIEALRSLRIMHYAAWLARRWEDPAFKVAFPWFDSRRYWDDHVLALREQVALMQEPPLEWRDF
jgi:Ser/Thr protein kinase RdoA (MazF antagonist)